MRSAKPCGAPGYGLDQVRRRPASASPAFLRTVRREVAESPVGAPTWDWPFVSADFVDSADTAAWLRSRTSAGSRPRARRSISLLRTPPGRADRLLSVAVFRRSPVLPNKPGRFCQRSRHDPCSIVPGVCIGPWRGRPDRWNVLRAARRPFRERGECTAQGYRRFRCRACGKQFNERSAGSLNRDAVPQRRNRPRGALAFAL